MSTARKSIAFLVKEIIKKDPSMIHIKDSALIPYYVHNSNHMLEIEHKDNTKLRYYTSKKDYYKDDFNFLKKKQIKLAKDVGANYIFASHTYCEDQCVCIVTPFAIISEKELGFLVKNFYKDVPEEVSKAASNLGIKLYDKEYKAYLNAHRDRDIELTFYSLKDNLISNFLNLVFSLPYEEQNIEVNKIPFKHHTDKFDYEEVLVKEYSQGRYFQKYFDSLRDRKKECIASRIASLEQHNINHDIFLLKKGFFVNTNPMDLYREDAGSFIKYFESGLDLGSKKFLIEQIYEESFINHKVVEWLEKNYSHLLREVGFAGGS